MNTTTETESTSKSYVTALLLVILGAMTSLFGASLFYAGKRMWGVLITLLVHVSLWYKFHFMTLIHGYVTETAREVYQRCFEAANGVFWFSVTFALLAPFVAVYKHNNKVDA